MTRIAFILAFAIAAGCGKNESTAVPNDADIQRIEAEAGEAAAKERSSKKQYQLED
jgi:hypothetical protein